MNEDIVYTYDYETELVKKEHIFLNNFEISVFKADDEFNYMSVEHYYQCHKFDNFEEKPEFKVPYEEIRNAASPLLCKKAARKNEKEFDDSWQKQKWNDGYKDEIMKRGLIYKFSQHPDLLKKLIDTGNSKIVEASYKDPYWGGILPGSLNKLGIFLCELRDNYVKNNLIYIDGSGIDPINL